MRRAWVAAALAGLSSAAGGIGCRSILGLDEPILEPAEGGAGEASAAEAGGDGGGDASTDSPNANYPAFRPEVPQLVFAPHPDQPPTPADVIGAPQVRGVYYASDALLPTLAPTFTAWVTSNDWIAQTRQYFVGTGLGAAMVQLTEAPPSSLTDADVRASLAAKLDGTHPEFGPVDPATLASEVFVLVYPRTTKIAGTSCPERGGYHGEVAIGSGRATYVVLANCSGLAADLAAEASYELLATVTNPRPVARPGYTSFDANHAAWNYLKADGATELPQPCSGEGGVILFEDSGLPVARSWSNESISQFHDPCVPALDGTPYFASSPVMTDYVTPPGGYSTQGIQIPVGQSRTVDVQLWSDGPTSGPWRVEASVAPGFPPAALSFVLDRDAGVNGDVLRLTVTAHLAGGIPFEVTSTLGAKQTVWMGFVGQ
jgi:hypothetical protein